MNTFTISRENALAVLSDELYALLHDARMAKFSLNELLEGYFDNESPDGSRACAERLMVGYERARAQAEITMDYIFKLTGALGALDTAARSYPQHDKNGDSGVLQQV